MSSNDSKCIIQTDLKGNIEHIGTTSLRCGNAFEKFENEYQSIENDRMLEYQVHQTSPNYSSPKEHSDTEVIEIDKMNDSLQFQGSNFEEITNLPVKCCDSREESSELKRKNLHEESVTLSAVGRSIRNAIDCLLGIDPWNTDHLLITTDSHFMDLISSDSKQRASISEVEFLNRNGENKSEITSEKLESEKYQFKQDSSLSRLLCIKSSEISTVERNFNPRTNKYEMHEQMFLENDYQSIHTRRKPFPCDVCQRTFTHK
ncbi:hypothetical protein NPIL_402291, partial [Nephila pilipes]